MRLSNDMFELGRVVILKVPHQFFSGPSPYKSFQKSKPQNKSASRLQRPLNAMQETWKKSFKV